MKGSNFSIRFRILEVLLGIDSNGELSSVDNYSGGLLEYLFDWRFFWFHVEVYVDLKDRREKNQPFFTTVFLDKY